MQRNHFISVLLCCVAILTSCKDVWEDHYQSEPLLNADETLWELIEQDENLSEFKKYLEQTGYDDLLKQDRFYTVWAPVNGFGYSETDTALWETEFVKNHIADYRHVASGKVAENNKVKMLNGKYTSFENSKGKFTFKGLSLAAENISAKNGVLHKINGYADFKPNIWEQLSREPELDSLYLYLSKGYELEFDKSKSTPGPVVDGKQIYLDSVFSEPAIWWRNDLGELNKEDSSYTMFALTNTAWREMYDLAAAYFNYPIQLPTEENKQGNVELRDSIRGQVVREWMCKNLVFSNVVNAKYFNGNPTAPYDTLYSNYKLWNINEALAFKGKEVAKLYEGAESKELSNGTLNIVNQVNYEPIKCRLHDTIRVEAESLVGKTSDEEGSSERNFDSELVEMDNVGIDPDSVALYDRISGHSLAVFAPTNESADNGVDLTFDVNNVMSAAYRVKIVVVPPHLIKGSDTLFIKPTPFLARLTFAAPDALGKPGTTIKLGVQGKDTITNNCDGVDEIVLWDLENNRDYIEVPVCEYSAESYFKTKPQTKLEVMLALPGSSGKYKKEYLDAVEKLSDARAELKRKEKEFLPVETEYLSAKEAQDKAQADYDQAFADFKSGKITKDEFQEYNDALKAIKEVYKKCQAAYEPLKKGVDELKAKIATYEAMSGGENANYDNVLRIDQVVFEPYDPNNPNIN